MFSCRVAMSLPSGANLREHWASRATRAKQHRDTGTRIAASYEWGGGQIIIECHRVGKRLLDDDNLAYAFKCLRDGLADGLGLTNDNDARLKWTYTQATGKEPCVIINFREAP